MRDAHGLRPVEERKGVVEYSPLVDHPGFHLLWSMPLDEFHLLKEGLTKCMLDRMVYMSSAKAAKDMRDKLNQAYSSMKVLSETSRRPRELKLAQLKGG